MRHLKQERMGECPLSFDAGNKITLRQNGCLAGILIENISHLLPFISSQFLTYTHRT